jgi:hypothetical protein
VTPLTLERLRHDGQALMEAISREHYRAHAGLQREAHLQPIFERHRGITSADSLALARELYTGASAGSEDQRSGRVLLEWQATMHSERVLAALDERQIAWESTAAAVLEDGSQMPFSRMQIEIANAADRAHRLMLERGRAALVAGELAPLRRERFIREQEVIGELGLADGAVETFSLLGGIDLRALGLACERFLSDSEPIWRDLLPYMIRRRLGIDPRDATRADALALLRAPAFDPAFQPGGAESAVRRDFSEAGLDVDAAGRIVHDTGEREGKRARAFCAPLQVPQEVYLVLRPHGGASDWRTYLHELGHALHFANADANLPFEFRWLGDNSVTESYAMLLDHLMHDVGWLRRHSALGSGQLPEFLHSMAFEELHFLRRYTAKLLYELHLYGAGGDLRSVPDAYVTLLGNATGFRCDPADAFVDVDPGFYSARYLRAWQLQAVLRTGLVERFEMDWYRNPRAGPWLLDELFARGQRDTAEELAQRVNGGTLEFGPLLRRIEEMLDGS